LLSLPYVPAAIVIAILIVVVAALRIRTNAKPLVQQDARPIEGHNRDPHRQAQGLPPADNDDRRSTMEALWKTALRDGPAETV